MKDAILLIAPAINVLVTASFAWVVLRQYLKRQRIYQLYWSIALIMAFVATVAYMLMLVAQPTSLMGMLFFRLYYALGGTIMPSWLGLGSLALVSPPRVTRIFLIALTILSVIAVSLVFSATINLPHLSQIAGTPGTGTLQPGPWLVMTITLNTLGVAAIAGVAAYSGWKLLRRSAEVAGLRASSLLWANVLILSGALLNGAAGTLARFTGLETLFWLIMAVGWLVFFTGVLLTSHRARAAVAAVQQTGIEQTERHQTA